MDVSENSGTPKSSILIGFSIIFTIHFGVPLFLETPILGCVVGRMVFPSCFRWRRLVPMAYVCWDEGTGDFDKGGEIWRPRFDYDTGKMVQKSQGQPPFGCIKTLAVNNGINYLSLNWLAGFLKHQQYHQDMVSYHMNLWRNIIWCHK